MKRRLISFILITVMLISSLTVEGLTATASGNDPRILIDGATVWRYLDDGTDPSEGKDRTAWTLPSFNDKNWKSSKGNLPKFGAQAGKLATFTDGTEIKVLLNQYLEGTTNVPTFFFRTELNLSSVPTNSKTAVGRVIFDDAVIIYVNGTRVAAFYELKGGYGSNLSYGGSGMGTPLTETFTFPTSLLKKGKNVIAVELHQSSAGSSDVYFEMPSIAVGIGGQTAVVMNVGATERERIITWRFPENVGHRTVEYAVRNGDEFPKDYEYDRFTSATSYGGVYSFTAKLKNLEYNTEYVYRLRNGDTVSENFYFKTDGPDEGFDFIFVGDAQIGASGNVATDTAHWKNTLNLATAMYPDAKLLVSAGDQTDSAVSDEQFKAFLSPEQLQTLAFAPTIGNHECYKDDFSKYYSLPNKSVNGYSNGATQAGGDYFFRYRNALFINLNTNNLSAYEHSLTIDAAIKAHPDVNWKFIIMHQSLFSGSGNFEKDPLIMAREQLVPLFTQYDIDVVLSGHDHVYSRSHIMSDGYSVIKCGDSVTDPDGILYLTAGSASASKYYGAMDASKATHSAITVTHKTAFTAIEVSESSFKLTTVDTDTKKPIDSFEIIKTKPKKAEKNIALNKRYNAPTAASDTPALLNDGIAKTDFDTQSNWYAVSDTANAFDGVANIDFDLGKAHMLTAIQIHLLGGSSRESTSRLYGTPESIEVFVSNNGKEYTPIGKLPLNEPSGQPKAYWSRLDSLNASARYVRVSIKLPRNTRVLLNEIRINGTPRTEPSPKEERLPNAALGKPYETSAVRSAFPDENGKTLTDGIISDATTAFDDPVWMAFYRQDQSYVDNGYAFITVDLEGDMLVDEFNIRLATRLQGAGIKAPYQVEVYTSLDGSEFMKQGYCLPADLITEKTTLATVKLGAPVKARLVQYRIIAEYSDRMLISEVEVFGRSAEKLYCDVNDNGMLDRYDYILIKRSMLAEISLTEPQRASADVITDGSVDKYDYITVKREIGTKTAA